MSEVDTPLKLFYSCSAADHELRNELEKHLASLEREGLIAGWHSRLVLPGSEVAKVVNKHIDQAAIVLLLVSSDFLASNYCFGIDVRRAMERHDSGDAVVVPVILRPCDWTSAPFAKCAVLPSDCRPIVKWEHRDDGFLEVARGVRGVVNRLRGEVQKKHDARVVAKVDRQSVDQLERLTLERDQHKTNDARETELSAQIDALVRELNRRTRPRSGDCIAGTELIKQLGSGSFATVWLSKHIDTGKLMATKIFDRDKLGQGVMLWRFRRGIRAMDHLARKAPHQHIARLCEVDESTLAFSMDYLSEGNLENVERRGWTLAKKIDMTVALCEAVQFAHSNGIIHRDIKPANIVLDSSHQPVLTDFDIVEIKFSATLSAVEGGLGTPMFAAPEQYVDSSKSDERSDVYSLGRLLYFLLLERSPGLQIEPDPSLKNLASFPQTLVAIVRRATQYAPERRYSSVELMRQAIVAHQTRLAILLAMLGRGTRFLRNNVAVAIVLAMLVAFVVGTAIFAVRERASAERERAAMAALQKLSDEFFQLDARVEAALANIDENRAQQGSIRDEMTVTRRKIDVLDKDIQASPTIDERNELQWRRLSLVQELAKLEQRANELMTEENRFRSELDAARQRRIHAQRASPKGPGNCRCAGAVKYTYKGKTFRVSGESECYSICRDACAFKTNRFDMDGCHAAYERDISTAK